jgi:hypothetical protein
VTRAADQGRVPAAVVAAAPAGLGTYGSKRYCGAGERARAPGVLGAELRSAAADGRLTAQVSPEALALVDAVDGLVDATSSAAELTAALAPIYSASHALASGEERALVQGTASTASASAYYVEAVCGANACPPADPTPPEAAQRASGERRAEHVNRTVIKADAWGCIAGAIRGWPGGPPGVLGGCIMGGLIGSGGAIWNHHM